MHEPKRVEEVFPPLQSQWIFQIFSTLSSSPICHFPISLRNWDLQEKISSTPYPVLQILCFFFLSSLLWRDSPLSTPYSSMHALPASLLPLRLPFLPSSLLPFLPSHTFALLFLCPVSTRHSFSPLLFYPLQHLNIPTSFEFLDSRLSVLHSLGIAQALSFVLLPSHPNFFERDVCTSVFLMYSSAHFHMPPSST